MARYCGNLFRSNAGINPRRCPPQQEFHQSHLALQIFSGLIADRHRYWLKLHELPYGVAGIRLAPATSCEIGVNRHHHSLLGTHRHVESRHWDKAEERRPHLLHPFDRGRQPVFVDDLNGIVKKKQQVAVRMASTDIVQSRPVKVLIAFHQFDIFLL